jgi:3-hydroxyisobutyrate dehydrogenase-like beta-hydroxyacid dehydrogenase
MAVVIAVLGLGEAGAAIAADIAARGVEVRGWDVRADATAPGVARADGPAQAAQGTDVVLSVTAAAAAGDAAHAVAGALRPGQVFADLNSAGAPLKRELAGVVSQSGALFADVALMAPVPGRGVATPALVSGDGAARFADVLGPLGMPVEVVGSEPGDAARLKLLRSVFMKGLAATVIESLAAARAAGREDWLRGEIVAELQRADAALVERLETGSKHHAERRIHEVDDAAGLLRELGIEPRVTEAARGWLTELRDG